MHRLQTINGDELKNVKLYDFIENKNYKVTLTHDIIASKIPNAITI